jgi:hypothetical protein
MIAKRYVRLSLIPLLMSLLGFVALAAPDPFRGPLVLLPTWAPQTAVGALVLNQSLYLADAVGLVLLSLATLEVWILAIAWEYRHRRR